MIGRAGFLRVRFACATQFLAIVLASANFPGVGLVLGQEPESKSFSADDLEFFEKQVRPLLAKRCFECHGPDVSEPSGGLHMVSHGAFIRGGETGPAVDSKDVRGSLLVQAINYSGLYEMPPESKMADAEIAILTQWVERGAPWPPTAETAAAGPKKFDLDQRRNNHWCWQPIVSPTIPDVANTSWPRRELDAFILHALEENKLAPAQEADPRTLVRRLYLDLIGLPPSSDQVAAFLNDQSSDAYEKLVDRLLASPQFGEHWARRWMDLVRYAETCGHEFDYPLPYAYQYRDYLIRAFNADVPYDQLVREHVAGDLLPQPRFDPESQINESIIATGFWFLGEATHGPVDVRSDEAGRIDNQIDVFGKSFLGLTVACARCHDHMFDAIAARDYYGLVGFMQSSRRQLALLDPGKKIEVAARDLADRQRKCDHELTQLRNSIENSDVSQESKYLAAAIACLNKNGLPDVPQSVRIQGEDLAGNKPTGGRVIAQDLSANDGVNWDGNKQLWWLDGKQGDRLSLEFSIANGGLYDIEADFTTAPDYATVRLSLDNRVVVESLDLYSARLGKTGPKLLSSLQLEPGKHHLGIEFIGVNPDAAPKWMFGFDYIDLKAQPEAAQKKHRENLIEVANQFGVDAQRLAVWERALCDGQLAEPSHPLFAVQRILKEREFGDASKVQARLNALEQQRADSTKLLNESPIFEDFANQLPNGWFRTGWAFGNGEHPAWYVDDSQLPDQLVGRAGTISSGRLGTPLYGVVRTPTFTIDHKFVHYRLSGREAQVRLIIDGFTLDVYNSLLFNGATLNVDSPNRFTWLTQGQDIGNYLGHRAHIEIIDHSGGSVAVDEIRFSNHAQLTDPPSNFADALLAELPASNEAKTGSGGLAAEAIDAAEFEIFSIRLWERIREAVAQSQPDSDGTGLLNWLIRWDLIDSEAFRTSRAALETLRDEKQRRLRENVVPAPIFAQALADGTGENEFIFIRGNPKTPGPEAARRLIDAIPTSVRFDLSSADGSGRLRLAEALLAPENPLTSRVIVNRLWHHLFGQGIVASVDNFGVLGEQPTHPELLDHLASKFVEHGWSIKQAIRNIVTSTTYRMSSQVNPSADQADPDNRLLHRMSVRRLSSETIRDSLLHVSGQLDTTMYGPSVPIYLTPFMQGRGRPGASGPLDGNRRRSIYIEVRRNFLSPMMLAFDTPSPFNAVGRRNVSNVPSQALILLNHPLVLQQAELWAARLLKSEPNPEKRLNRLFLEAYARPISESEAEMAQQFLAAQRQLLENSSTPADQSELQAWRDLCHVLINAKEFYYIN